MMKAVFAKNVKVGDIVTEYEGRPLTVAEVRENTGPNSYCRIELLGTEGERWIGAETQALVLLSRPWPEGKTEADMVNVVALRAWAVGRLREKQDPLNEREAQMLDDLCRSIEAYRLGMSRSDVFRPPTPVPPPKTAEETAGCW